MNQLVKKNQKAFTDLESTSKELSDLITDAGDDVNDIVQNDILKGKEDYREASHEMKRSFGDILYTILCPINGYPLKNRRYADGEHKNMGRDTAEGPAVHHKIGSVQNWSSKASWYNASDVWDKMRQEHVDLTHNGIKSRKDTVEVMQDFLDTREAINKVLVPRDADGAKTEIRQEFSLDKAITVEAIHYVEVDGMKCVKGSWKRKVKKGYVSSDKVVMLVSDLWNKDSGELEIGQTGKQHQTINLALTGRADVTFKYDDNWKEKLAVFGMENILLDSTVATAFLTIGKEYNKGYGLWQALKDRYAGRVLLKGAF